MSWECGDGKHDTGCGRSDVPSEFWLGLLAPVLGIVLAIVVWVTMKVMGI